MPPENENVPAVPGARASQGSNAQRRPKAAGRPKKSAARAAADIQEIERLTAMLAEAQKTLEDQAARGAGTAASESQEAIVRIEKPKGEAGDRKKGFVLQTAMELNDDQDTFDAILRSVHDHVARANLDVTQDYRNQDPAKIAAVFKLTRKAHPYLTEKRFPLNWSTAEMVKQYLRNKRRYGVRCGYIPKHVARKHGGKNTTTEGSNRRHRVPHIDEDPEGNRADLTTND
ncbi:hypothetical protein DFH09DRAFT_1296188 [Mycena vulgaris]|nr:hypothetical protein DFH09DRAFT_1296188 [Mycena vulgaris]